MVKIISEEHTGCVRAYNYLKNDFLWRWSMIFADGKMPKPPARSNGDTAGNGSSLAANEDMFIFAGGYLDAPQAKMDNFCWRLGYIVR